MNPAALISNIQDLKPNGMVIVNTDKFGDRDLAKAECMTNPLEDGSLEAFQVVPVPLGSLTKNAVKEHGLNVKEADRCKNFFALGMTYWLFNRDLEVTKEWIRGKFKQPYLDANISALMAGYNYADTIELFHSSYEVLQPKLPLAPTETSPETRPPPSVWSPPRSSRSARCS